MSVRISRRRRMGVSFFVVLALGAVAAYAQRVPPPEEVIGFRPGEDFHLASYQQALEYFEVLDEASPMIELFEMGETTMGNPMVYAVISAAENLESLDRYKTRYDEMTKAPIQKVLGAHKDLFEAAYKTPEHKEAVQAFLEKRAPDFRRAAAEASS